MPAPHPLALSLYTLSYLMLTGFAETHPTMFAFCLIIICICMPNIGVQKKCWGCTHTCVARSLQHCQCLSYFLLPLSPPDSRRHSSIVGVCRTSYCSSVPRTAGVTAALSVSLVLLTAPQSPGQQASRLQASMLMWQCSVTVTTAGTRKIKGFRDVFTQEWCKETFPLISVMIFHEISC